ncbi:glycosyltransferase family 9 protein [Paraburkholderia sp. ZP32-5]|uniref:glycosyltransferase family 9 protein n=1 Tax=Paraburkholderia sp. ZP32-5 TaxID=2883245 RepID=UPI001F353C06|nr:glycosyltransferase family 9 protein [Paraburkholderia sp. ZP32-5]
MSEPASRDDGAQYHGRIAISMSNALGDTLVLMTIAYNLHQAGVDVTVFGSQAHALRQWFPRIAIYPLPHGTDARAAFAPYDVVLQMHRHQPLAHLRDVHPNVRDLDDVIFGDRPGCMAERFADFCRDSLGLREVVTGNGITPPATLRHRIHQRRVAIHPEASTEDKRWLAARFIRLARQLSKRGYEVHFVIAPHERERWRALERAGIAMPEFDSVDALASWLYESGWFIGNDSGVGHLASNLRVPTISLFRRRGVSERWRPAWGTVRVVLPWQWVPTAGLKERFWRQTLTCSRVMAAFRSIVRDDSASSVDGALTR